MKTPRNVQTAEERVKLVSGAKVGLNNPDRALHASMAVDVMFPNALQ